MITIVTETDGTFTMSGITKADMLTLYMIAQTVYQEKKPQPQLSMEAFRLGELIEDFYGEKITYLA